MPLAKPTLSVELGLTAGFRDGLASIAWTDITNYVQSWGTSRGREPRKPPSSFEAGQASLTLNNRDRRFDPTNTAGPYYPNLRPARVRLRIRANWPSILTPNQATIERDAADWAAFVNCTVARSTAFAAEGTASLRMTAVAAGSMQAYLSSFRPVTPGQQMTALASFRAGSGTPAASIAILWVDEAGGAITLDAGVAIVTGTAGFTQATATYTAPAGARTAALFATVAATGAGQVAYVDKFSLAAGASTTWVPPYDVFTGYVKRWPPEWTASATSTVKISAVDALGAPLNLPQVYATLFETVVRHDDPIAWWRMAETSGAAAVDATMHRHDGQYQGTPTLGQGGLMDTDAASKSVRFVTGSRLSVPNKNLIPGYPFSLETWFKAGADNTGARMIFSAYDGAASSSNRQNIQVMILPSAYGADAGRVIASVANPYPTGTTVKSTITVNDVARHHLVVVFTSSTSFTIYIDGADRTTAVVSAAHSFPNDLVSGYAVGNNPAFAFEDYRFGYGADDLLGEVVIYDTALSAARVYTHFAAGVGYASILAASGQVVGRLLDEADWPAADRNIDAGESLLQSIYPAGGLTAALQKVEESEQGALYVSEAGVVTFEDRHALLRAPYTTSQVTLGQGVGDQPYEPPVVWGNDDAELFNRATGGRVGGPTYTVEDEASIDEFGERPLGAITGLLNLSDAEVVDLLTYRVQKYAQPAETVRQVRLHPAAVPALYPYVLGLGLRSRITVKVAPIGGGPVFSQESHIERPSHTVDDQGDWWTVWDISAADSAGYWVLDDPVRGLLDSGNRIAF